MTTTTQSNEKAAPAVQLPVDLRDYFAAKWLQGWVANPETANALPEQAAKWAYSMADAMLAERAK